MQMFGAALFLHLLHVHVVLSYVRQSPVSAFKWQGRDVQKRKGKADC